MGIGGLTSFIDENSHLLKDHRLHDSKVVIDGNNLYFFLYNYYDVSYRYGGNLNDFANCVATYFNTLQTCNIEPYVIFDGAYQTDERKWKTVKRRLKNMVETCLAMSKGGRGKLFPCLTVNVFQNVLSTMGVKFATCMFEADDQIAALANALNCPVMSNDSDFFIYDLKGGFIVYDYVCHEILSDERTNETDGTTEKYNYLLVQIYYNTALVEKIPCLDKSMLPLFACLYGNDVIDREIFDFFYMHTKLPSVLNLNGGLSGGTKYSKILRLLLWLSGIESREVAMEIVLRSIQVDPKIKLDNVRRLLNSAIESYTVTEGYLETYFRTGEMPWLIESEPGKTDLGPTWFLYAAFAGRTDRSTLNMAHRQMALLKCQVEDIRLPSAYQCSMDLRQIVYSVMCPKHKHVSEFDRDLANFKCYKVEIISSLPSGRKIPDAYQIPQMTKGEKFEILIDAFGLEDQETIRGVDNQLVLVILSVAFWRKNSLPKVDERYLYSLLLCMIKLGLNVQRRKSKIEEKRDVKRSCHPLDSPLDGCPEGELDEAWSALQKFTKQRDSGYHSFIKGVHNFSQFQGTLLAALQLNSVLQDVVPPPCPSHILCGTFLYSTYRDLCGRRDARKFIELLLEKSPQVLSIMNRLIEMVTRLLPDGLQSSLSKKKKKKRGKPKSKIPPAEPEPVVSADSDAATGEDTSYLASNRFASLAASRK